MVLYGRSVIAIEVPQGFELGSLIFFLLPSFLFYYLCLTV